MVTKFTQYGFFILVESIVVVPVSQVDVFVLKFLEQAFLKFELILLLLR